MHGTVDHFSQALLKFGRIQNLLAGYSICQRKCGLYKRHGRIFLVGACPSASLPKPEAAGNSPIVEEEKSGTNTKLTAEY
jgi:hypothetical protein